MNGRLSDYPEKQRVFQALETAIDLANQGQSANDALFKAASDYGMTPHFVRRMVEAFNTSRTLAHLKQASSPNERSAVFELADADDILQRLYPNDVPAQAKAAAVSVVDDDWFAPPERNFNKAAVAPGSTVIDPDEGTTFDQAAARGASRHSFDNKPNMGELVGRIQKESGILARRAQEHHQLAFEQYERLMGNLQKVSSYFRSMDHRPFHEVESNALFQHGVVVQPVMDMVFNMSKRAAFGERRGGMPIREVLFNHRQSPYVEISNALENAAQLAKEAAAEAKIRNERESFIKQANEKLTLIFRKTGFDSHAGGKSAALGGLLGAVWGQTKQPNPVVTAADIINPEDEAAMRGADAQVTLVDLLANDEVISTYPREDVIKAYNDLAGLLPNAATQPVILRPLLRKMLQQGGVVDPFDLKPVESTEKDLLRINPGGIDNIPISLSPGASR